MFSLATIKLITTSFPYHEAQKLAAPTWSLDRRPVDFSSLILFFHFLSAKTVLDQRAGGLDFQIICVVSLPVWAELEIGSIG